MSETDGAQIAYGNALDAFPTWQSLTRVNAWEMRRGRVDETQRTGTGTCSIYVNDMTGYLGSSAEFPIHARVSLRGYPRFRGLVDEVNVEVDNSGIVSRVAVECVDLFDYLSGVELIQGVHGYPPPVGSEQYVFYENQQVDERIKKILDDALVPSTQRSIFSGNVNVMDTRYSSGTTATQALDDACDAEWSGVANRFVDALGRYCFRGRFARFDPSNPTYGIQFWQAGTGTHVTAGVAQIRELAYSSPRKLVVNAALAYPDGMDEKQIPNMIYTDSTSIQKHGVRSWSAENLLTLRHNTNGNTGAEEARLFSQYQVQNYSSPVPRISRIVFRSHRDSDTRAAATWALMCQVEIGDVIDVNTDWISGRYFVEGITTRAQELDGTIPDVTCALDLSPAAHWTIDPF